MSFSHLPCAIAVLLRAAQDGDRAAFLSAFADDAVVSEAGREHRGPAVQAWAERFLPLHKSVRPVNVLRSADKAVVTVVVTPADRSAGKGAAQFDWTLSISGSKLSRLDINPSTQPALPDPVSAYVRATNAFDLERLMDTFAEDAVVNDQLREYRGKAAIASWAAREIVGARMTMYVVGARERPGNADVAASVDGDFDRRGLPDPLVLAFYFSFHAGKIDQLIILRNEPDI